MAPHSGTLAWKIPRTEEPGRLRSMGSLRVEQSDFTFTFHFSLSCTGEGNGRPLQCSCLENLRDGAARWAAVYGFAQSWTRLQRHSSSSSSSSSSKPNSRASPMAQQGKNLPAIQEIQEISIPGLGGSPGVRNNYPLQCCCLKSPMDRGAGHATVQQVTKTQTRLSN